MRLASKTDSAENIIEDVPRVIDDFDLFSHVNEIVEGTGQVRLVLGQEGIVTGGNSTILGKNMMESMGLNRTTKWSGYQAQHIIPAEMTSNSALQKIGMDLDDASNGIFLRINDDMVSSTSRHQGYHSVYNEVVKKQLDNMDVNLSIDVLQQQVQSNFDERYKEDFEPEEGKAEFINLANEII